MKIIFVTHDIFLNYKLFFNITQKTLQKIHQNTQRFEFVHPADVALAFSNSVNVDIENEILIIGGGKECLILYHELIDKMMDVFNLPPTDPSKLTTKCYYLDYYDTERSQKLLQYQTRTVDDFIEDFRENIGITGNFVRAFAPIAKFFV